MANFLLVHGAWHGAWCWREVAVALIRAGHRAHAVTLTGLGERAHLLTPDINLETHITDVIQALETEELAPCHLVVHSYAGMLGTAVADRRTSMIKHLVYVDAVVPKPGESWSSTQASQTREERLKGAAASALYAFPSPDPKVFGLAGPEHAWVQRRQAPHPGHTYLMPLDFDIERVASVPRTWINCTSPSLPTIDPTRLRVQDPRFWDGRWAKASRIVNMATGHDPMISEPAALTRILLDSASTQT